MRVVFTSEKPLDGELSLVAPDGSVAAKSRKRFGGPPYFWFAEVVAPAAGKWRANLASSDCGNVGREIAVRADQPQRPQTAAGKRLAGAQRVGSRHGEPVLGLGRETV